MLTTLKGENNMPNHISNKLTIIGEEQEVKEVLEFIKEDNLGLGTIDFNKITPMPKWIYGSTPDVQGISREDEEKWGKENTVLHWSIKHWGTKWNAYSQPDHRNTANTIYFQTAWSEVTNLIQKIAWIFPEVTIEYSFADEDLGSNCGVYQFKGTEILEADRPVSLSKKAYELAFELVQEGEVPEWFKFHKEKNNYEYIEEE